MNDKDTDWDYANDPQYQEEVRKAKRRMAAHLDRVNTAEEQAACETILEETSPIQTDLGPPVEPPTSHVPEHCLMCMEVEARQVLLALQINDAMYGMAIGFTMAIALIGVSYMFRRRSA